MAMKLTTGKVAFPIEFDNGDKQVIYFNPQSKTFREKIFNFEKSVSARIKSINIDKYKNVFEDGISIDADISDINGIMALSDEQFESLRNKAEAISKIEDMYQDAIKVELDDIFESPISAVVFKYCQPLDYVTFVNDNGEEESEMFIMQFIRALYAEISKYANTHNEAMQKHIGKYKK